MTTRRERINANFNYDQFVADVKIYCKRQGWGPAHLARHGSMTGATMRNFWNKKNFPAVETVYALAMLCDLNLNRYLKETTDGQAA